MVSADYVNNQGDIVGHGVLPNGHQRMFLLIRNPRSASNALLPVK